MGFSLKLVLVREEQGIWYPEDRIDVGRVTRLKKLERRPRDTRSAAGICLAAVILRHLSEGEFAPPILEYTWFREESVGPALDLGPTDGFDGISWDLGTLIRNHREWSKQGAKPPPEYHPAFLNGVVWFDAPMLGRILSDEIDQIGEGAVLTPTERVYYSAWALFLVLFDGFKVLVLAD